MKNFSMKIYKWIHESTGIELQQIFVQTLDYNALKFVILLIFKVNQQNK